MFEEREQPTKLFPEPVGPTTLKTLCFNIFVISNKLILQDNVILGGQTFKI
jgi:hypothetical protein